MTQPGDTVERLAVQEFDHALWSKLGNALVIRRPDGEFLTFLDYSKGGVARGWDLLP